MNYAQALPEPEYCRQPDRINVKSFYAWNKRSEVGIHKLDDQHRELFSTLNRLHDHLLSYSALTLINKYFSNLTDQARAHFKTEEEIMQAHGCPGYALHKSMHDLLIRQLDDIRPLISGEYRKLWITERLEIAEFLHSCLVSHLEEDKKIGVFGRC